MHRGFQILARVFLGLASAFLVASCGSGSVGSVVVDPTTITIQPGTDGSPVTLYSGLPTTFTITGGTGTYIVSSNNQATLPVSGPITGNTLTVIPNPVIVDTLVTLTARDTGSTLPASVQLLVKPGTVSNTITITPSNTACAPAICSGGDAVIAATISQGGIPLPARGVRFEVLSGDVRFVTSPAGVPETTALSVTTVTDETGTARVRLRALDAAANQTAVIQITDLGSGAYQRTTVIVARSSAEQAGFFTVPTTITFSGPDNTRCSSGASAEFFIFGGAPPYTISNSAPTAFVTNTNVVGTSGGSFRVTTTGQCASNITFAITDAAGRVTTVTLNNQLGTAAPPPAPLAVSPGSLLLPSCSSVASAVIVGGQGNYVAASENGLVLATVTGSILRVSRLSGGPAPGIINVNVSDGRTVFTVPVTLGTTGPSPASGVCP